MSFCRNSDDAGGRWVVGVLVMLFVLMSSPRPSAGKEMPTDLPGVLQPWVDWVLHGKEREVKCVPRYDDPRRLACRWPGRLNLSLGDKGGRFDQTWEILHDTWVPLPGRAGQWPRHVQVNGGAALLMERQQRPVVHLTPGRYRITGEFQWQTSPEYLQIPPDTGLFALQRNGRSVRFPSLDTAGRLWFKGGRKEKKVADRLKVEQYRKIEDAIPPRVTLFTTLEVAGSAREITLGPLYDPALFVPLSLKSDLPARLAGDGSLRLQVRPGRYAFTLTMRYVKTLAELTLNSGNASHGPDHEIWSVVRRPQLRIVEISGVPAVDPRLTSLPAAWQDFPAYRVRPGETMTFKEIKRGDPVPAPDRLSLDRTLWLRFDGSGFTVQDKITGQKNSDWRLEMDAGMMPGKVTVDGMEQLITRRAATDRPGVELRKGMLNVMAENRFDQGISRVPATGWDHDFNRVTGRLHLPPGWTLLHAGGMDRIPGTWLKKWTLLDFFMVLIFTIATAKLFSVPLALVGFITLALIFHDPLAPRFVWPLLLVGIALLRHLPPGRFRKLIKFLHGGVVLTLVFIAVPYAVHTLRVGIYPQLEKPWISMTGNGGVQPVARHDKSGNAFRRDTAVQEAESYRPGSLDKARKMVAPLMSPRVASDISSPRPMKLTVDPDAMTQTGPGLPRWRPFTTVPFSWSGPVAPGEWVTFTLIGPGVNRLLAFLRVGLMALLAAGLLGGVWKRKTGALKAGAGGMTALFALGVMLWAFPAHAGEIPSSEMLETLQERLLERADCFPACADVAAVDVTVDAHHLRLNLQLNARVDTMVPLPGHADHWLPHRVTVDGLESDLLVRENGVLWMRISAGRHDIVLKGPLPSRNTLQIPFSLSPRFTAVTAHGWTVQGRNVDGTLDGPLHFTRIATAAAPREEILETGVLPGFARVERHLVLGKEWRVETTVHRMSPPGSAMALHIPLLPGESVSTRGVTVAAGRVLVNLTADRTRFTWKSFLEPVDTLTLAHEETRDWTEVWTLDVAPRFHVETNGIPVILHQVSQRWMPTWHPWPGESVTLNISRPTPVKGNTLTLEKSRLVLRPGKRSTQAHLSLEMKSSRGGQHIIRLPENARLEEIAIDGRVQLIRQEGRSVPLPVSPGTHRVTLKWREARGMGMFFPTSDVDLGHAGVNAGLDIHLPGNRWPLFVGGEPLTGPAVLFWSVLFVVAGVSAGVAFSGLTPLGFFPLFLLGVGMSMSSLWACFLVGAWLVAMNRRKKSKERATRLRKKEFNLIQTGLAMLTLAAAGALLFAVSRGLLGHPDMNITGNGSSATLLRWYQDVSDTTLPAAWVISIPMICYRLAMLAWALWISFGLIGIVKWAWRVYTTPVIWYKLPRKPFRLLKRKQPGDDGKGSSGENKSRDGKSGDSRTDDLFPG